MIKGDRLDRNLEMDIVQINDLASNPTEKTVRIAIVEDRNEIREGLARLVALTEGFECSAAYRSMEEALAKIPENIPDIILADIGLPGISGIEGVKLLKERYPELKVLMLSVYDDNDRIIEAICAGASGYVLKNTSTVKLIASIKEVLQGGARCRRRSRVASSSFSVEIRRQNRWTII